MTAHDERDEELRRRFAELRARDTSDAPSYDTVIERARMRRTRQNGRRSARLPLFVAAVLLLAISLVVSRAWDENHRREATRGRASTSLGSMSSWSSPTASLLRLPGREPLYSTPDLSASIVDRVIPSHESEDSGS